MESHYARRHPEVHLNDDSVADATPEKKKPQEKESDKIEKFNEMLESFQNRFLEREKQMRLEMESALTKELEQRQVPLSFYRII